MAVQPSEVSSQQVSCITIRRSFNASNMTLALLSQIPAAPRTHNETYSAVFFCLDKTVVLPISITPVGWNLYAKSQSRFVSYADDTPLNRVLCCVLLWLRCTITFARLLEGIILVVRKWNSGMHSKVLCLSRSLIGSLNVRVAHIYVLLLWHKLTHKNGWYHITTRNNLHLDGWKKKQQKGRKHGGEKRQHTRWTRDISVSG